MTLLNKCNLVINKQIDQDQMKVLGISNPGAHQEIEEQEFGEREQTNIISHLTAQLQGINWLVSDMKVNLHDLINKDLLFNIWAGVGIFETDGVPSEDQEKQIIDDNMNKRIIKCLYFRQLYDLLTE